MQGTSDIPFPYDITIYKGSSFKAIFNLYDVVTKQGTPLNYFTAYARLVDADGNTIIEFTTEIDVDACDVILSLTPDQTATLEEQTGSYDVILKKYSYVSPPVITGNGIITSAITPAG